LVAHNVPFDVAFSLDAEDRRLWVIILGEVIEKREYDWGRQEWR
jgi:hypothetical protein